MSITTQTEKFTVKEITEEAYDYLLEVLPPIYIEAKSINAKATSAFACSEAYDYAAGTVVLTVCWKEKHTDGAKHYQQNRAVYTAANKPIDDTYGHAYQRKYISKEVN